MILQINRKKKKVLLFGSKTTEEELRAQIKFVEQVSDSLKEDFVKAFTRIYEWEPVLEWEYVDFIYDIEKRTLEPFVPEEEEGGKDGKKD